MGDFWIVISIVGFIILCIVLPVIAELKARNKEKKILREQQVKLNQDVTIEKDQINKKETKEGEKFMICPKCGVNFIEANEKLCKLCKKEQISQKKWDYNAWRKDGPITITQWKPADSNESKNDSLKIKRRIFFVFQGFEYEHELKNGYLFAHMKFNVPSWVRLTELKKGDLIFHCEKGAIRALGEVNDEWKKAPRPRGHYWNGDTTVGWKVDVNYTILANPLITSSYKKEIIQYQGDPTGKGYPFNKNGTGNQGYLFYMNNQLAKFFFGEIIRKNSILLEKHYIKEMFEINNMQSGRMKTMNSTEQEQKFFWERYKEILMENGEPFMISTNKHWAVVNRHSAAWDKPMIGMDFLLRDKLLRINAFLLDDVSLYQRLFYRREEIENVLGFKPQWVHGNRGTNTYRIELELPFNNKDDYEGLIEKSLPIVERFIKAFKPYLQC